MQYPMPVDMAAGQINKKSAQRVRRRNGMRHRHCKNIEKELRTRLERWTWSKSKAAETGGWSAHRKGRNTSVTWCLVPESQLPREDPGKPNILSLRLLECFYHHHHPHHVVLCPRASIRRVGDMGAENGQPGPTAKVSDVVATYRPTRVSAPSSARLCSPPQPQH